MSFGVENVIGIWFGTSILLPESNSILICPEPPIVISFVILSALTNCVDSPNINFFFVP